jgi:MFS family permease
MFLIASSRLRELFATPDFARIWFAGICSGVSRWLEMLVVGVYAFEATGSPLLVTLLVALRLAPLVLLGSVIGALADRASPRLLFIAGQCAAVVLSATVCGLFLAGLAEYWMIATASFASGIVWATDMPLRRRMLGDIVTPERIPVAMGFDSATNSATRMAGPLAGGLAFQYLGAEGAFAAVTVLYALSVRATLRVSAGIETADAAKRLTGILGETAEAFRHAFADRDILRILLVTVVYNVWAFPFVSMIPVIGLDRLEMTAGWVGALVAVEGAGAFFGGLVLATTAHPALFRRIYYFGTVAYLAFAFVAAWVTGVASMTVVVLCVGLGSAGFTAIQSTLIYTVAPPHMRGRLFGLMVLCIGMGIAGMFNIGLMAEWFGAAIAVSVVSAEGLLAMVLIGIGWHRLWGR